MFDYTKTAANKIIADFKRFFYWCQVVTQVVYIGYLIYALFTNTKLWIVNSILLVLSVAYFLFFLIATAKEANKTLKKRVKIFFRRCKQALNLFTLGVMVYGIWQTSTNAKPFSVILTALMIVCWVLQVLFEVILKFVLDKAHLIWEAVQADKEEIAKPVKTVGNFFKRITGREVEETQPPSETRILLDGMVEEYREQKVQARKDKKLAKKQEKRQAKIDRKQKKADAKAAKKKNRRVHAPIEEIATSEDN